MRLRYVGKPGRVQSGYNGQLVAESKDGQRSGYEVRIRLIILFGLNYCQSAICWGFRAIIALLALSNDAMVAAEGRSAAALLRGAESVRLRCTSMRVELALNYKLPPPMANMDCLVEFDNDKRRFEVLTASSPFCGVVIVNAIEVYAYRRQAHADVR